MVPPEMGLTRQVIPSALALGRNGRLTASLLPAAWLAAAELLAARTATCADHESTSQLVRVCSVGCETSDFQKDFRVHMSPPQTA